GRFSGCGCGGLHRLSPFVGDSDTRCITLRQYAMYHFSIGADELPVEIELRAGKLLLCGSLPDLTLRSDQLPLGFEVKRPLCGALALLCHALHLLLGVGGWRLQ